MSRHLSPKVTAKDSHGHGHVNPKKSHAGSQSPLRVGVPNAEKLSQLGLHNRSLNLVNPQHVHLRHLEERYAALERHLIDLSEENARLQQVVQETSQKEREKFETLLKLTNLNFGMTQPQSQNQRTVESQLRLQLHLLQSEQATLATQTQPRSELTLQEAHQAILTIYSTSESLVPTLSRRQVLAQTLAEDTFRRQAEIGHQISVRKAREERREARRRASHKSSNDSTHSRGRGTTEAIINGLVSSMSRYPSSALSPSKSQDSSLRIRTQGFSAVNPFEALGLTPEDARFRLNLRLGALVHVWTDGEWVQGTVSRFKQATPRSQLLQVFEYLVDEQFTSFTLPESASLLAPHTTPSLASAPQNAQLIPGLFPEITTPLAQPANTVALTTGSVGQQSGGASPAVGSTVITSSVVPLKLPIADWTASASSSPGTPASVASAHPGSSPFGAYAPILDTPVLNSIFGGQETTYVTRDTLITAARRLTSTTVEIRIGRVTTSVPLLSPNLMDATHVPSHGPDYFEQRMLELAYTSRQSFQQRQDQTSGQLVAGLARGLDGLDLASDQADASIPTLLTAENALPGDMDGDTASDTSLESDCDGFDDTDNLIDANFPGSSPPKSDERRLLDTDLSDDDMNTLFEDYSTLQRSKSGSRSSAILSTSQNVESNVPELSRSGSSLLRVTTIEDDYAATCAELRVMRMVANKLAAAVLPADMSVLGIIEPALRNASHASKVCERVARALQVISDRTALDRTDEERAKHHARLEKQAHQSSASVLPAILQDGSTTRGTKATPSPEAVERRRRLRKAARRIEWLRSELVSLEPPLFKVCEELHKAGLEAPAQAMAYLSGVAERLTSDTSLPNQSSDAQLPAGTWIAAAAGVHAVSNVLFSTQVEVLECVSELRCLIDQTDALLTSLGLPPQARFVSAAAAAVAGHAWLPQLLQSDSQASISGASYLEAASSLGGEVTGTSAPASPSPSHTPSGSLPGSPTTLGKPAPFVSTAVPPSLLRGPSVLVDEAPAEDPEAVEAAARAAAEADAEAVRKAQQIQEARDAKAASERQGLTDDVHQRYLRRQGSGEDSLTDPVKTSSSRGRYLNQARYNRYASDTESSSSDSERSRTRRDLNSDISSGSESEDYDNHRYHDNDFHITEDRDYESRHRDPVVVKSERRRRRRIIRDQRRAEKQERRLVQSQLELEQSGYVPHSFLNQNQGFGWSSPHQQTYNGFHNNNNAAFGSGRVNQGFAPWNSKPFYTNQGQYSMANQWQHSKGAAQQHQPQQQPQQQSTAHQQRFGESWNKSQFQQSNFKQNNQQRQQPSTAQQHQTQPRHHQQHQQSSHSHQTVRPVSLDQRSSAASHFVDNRPYSSDRFPAISYPPNTTLGQIRSARAQVETQALECASKLIHLTPSNSTAKVYLAQLTTLEDLLWVYEQLTIKLRESGAAGSDIMSEDLLALLHYENLQPAVRNVIAAVEGKYHTSPAAQAHSRNQKYQPPIIAQGPTTRSRSNPSSQHVSFTTPPLAPTSSNPYAHPAQPSPNVTPLPAPTLASRKLENVQTSSLSSSSQGIPLVPLTVQIPNQSAGVRASTPQAPPLRAQEPPALSLEATISDDGGDDDAPGLPPPVLTRAGPNVQ